MRVLGIAIGVILVGQNPDSSLSLASNAHAQPAARAGGPVPRINMKDISAMLVYRDTSKVAGVLVERR